MNWARFPNFREDEFRCRHTGFSAMDEIFMQRLQDLRSALGFPFVINSGYRHPTHPVEAAKVRPGAHSLGKAADIRLAHGGQTYDVLTRAREFGFTGIGMETIFVHLDICTTADLGGTVRPAAWSY